MLGSLINTSLTAVQYVAVPVATVVVSEIAQTGAKFLFPSLFSPTQTPEEVEANSGKLAAVASGLFVVSMAPVMLLSDSTPLKTVSATAAGLYCRMIYENPNGYPRQNNAPVTNLIYGGDPR